MGEVDKAQDTVNHSIADGDEGAAIRDALAALEVKGLVTGDLKFDENGDAIKTYAVIKTIKDGEIVYFSTYNG